MTWSIRAFAQLMGVTVKALHHYERRGLLSPQRSPAGYRRYSLRDLKSLDRVLALKSLGFPLAEIARFIAPQGQIAPKSRRALQEKSALRARRDQLAQLR